MRLENVELEEDFREDWLTGTIEAPIFRDAAVKVVVCSGEALSFGPSARASETIEIGVHCEVAGQVCELHRNAFRHLMRRPVKYEKRLTRLLKEASDANLHECRSDHDAGRFRAFVRQHKLGTLAGVPLQVELNQITFFDSGWDDCGVVAFDFSCGWEAEHGMSVLTHQNRVLACAGSSEFTCRGDSLLSHARLCQSRANYDVAIPETPQKHRQRSRQRT